MRILETERLRLRMFRESDIDAYAAMLGDPEVMRGLGNGQPMSRADAWRHRDQPRSLGRPAASRAAVDRPDLVRNRATDRTISVVDWEHC